jgi:hypothetical protein
MAMIWAADCMGVNPVRNGGQGNERTKMLRKMQVYGFLHHSSFSIQPSVFWSGRKALFRNHAAKNVWLKSAAVYAPRHPEESIPYSASAEALEDNDGSLQKRALLECSRLLPPSSRLF